MSKQGAKVRFGSVTIIGNKPSASLVKKNVERSTVALERVLKRLDRPGVEIRRRRAWRIHSSAQWPDESRASDQRCV
jgi:hypothetical protein